MTTLINPADLEAIKAKREQPTPPSFLEEMPDDCAVSPTLAMKINTKQWQRGYVQTLDLIGEMVTEAVKTPDIPGVAAQVMIHLLNLIGYGMTQFCGPVANPRKNVREETSRVLALVGETMTRASERAIKEGLPEVEAAVRDELQVDNLMHAASAAQLEATATRRELETARQKHAQQVDNLNAELKTVRHELSKLQYDTQKAARRAASDLADMPRLHSLIGDLERQVLALKREKASLLDQFLTRENELLAQLDELTQPQEAPMYPRIPSNALECASLTVYLKAQGIPATWDSVGVDHGGLMTNAHADAWREAYPTPEAMLTQLRAVVRPILGSVAA